MTERWKKVKEKARDLLPLGMMLGGVLGCGGVLIGADALQSAARQRGQEDAKNNLHLEWDIEEVSNPWCALAKTRGEETAEGLLGHDPFPWRNRGKGAYLGDQEFYSLGYGAYVTRSRQNPELQAFAGGDFEYRGEQYTVTPRYETGDYGVIAFDGFTVSRTCNNVEVIFK